MLVFEHYEDSNGESVAPQELWYTLAEYGRMTLAVKEAVFEVWRRQRATTEVHENPSASAAAGTHDEAEDSPSPIQAEAEKGSVLSDCVGIEHLLTRASVNEVRTCRARCVEAVLEEQARQEADQSSPASSRLGWIAIARSSLTQTRKTMLRARMLGQLHHQESI